ncbi:MULTISPECIES: HlyC/CorC family transporter [Aliagarivorans]|uniref:HlyC/CorC family transporter n=1 Tax=Aliagarivorans TaxID=882379 RepID=UPI000409B6BA|nr:MULTISPECIES: CNNM domain-containing protein [Aliagarivorans]
MDELSTSTLLLILAFLICCSAFFSSSETGMMSLNRYRLRNLVNKRHRAAMRVDKLLKRPDKLIGLILIGNNLVNIMASAIATVIGLRLFGSVGIAIATFTLTFVILVFAEVTPKTLATMYPEKIAYPASWLYTPMLKLLMPLVWVTNSVTGGVLWLLRIKPDQSQGDALSREELRTVVHEAGAMIPQRHQDMLLGILDLEKVTVDDIMVPRNEIVAIDVNDDWEDIQRQLTQSSHTKVLVYRDNIDDAVGFVHARDALRLLSRSQFDKTSLLRALKQIYFIPENTPLNVQLLNFQMKKERIGLIVDEYGDIQGLVTLEDILEEIVGDFTTNMAPDPSDEIHPQIDGSYLVDGTANIRDLNKEMGWKLPTDGPKTLNGLIVEHLEDIPDANLCVRLSGYPMEIIEVENNTVTLARVIPSYYRKPRSR